MSVDIGWETISSGPDGAALAEKIRDFVHDKFQQITLPRFIRAVHVHSFELGTAAPEIEIKDICDPLPDFYDDDDEDEEDEEDDDDNEPDVHGPAPPGRPDATAASLGAYEPGHSKGLPSHLPAPRPTLAHLSMGASQTASLATLAARDILSPSADLFGGPFPRSSTPGIPGGTSNLSYFPFSGGGGLSGAQTPLAAVASGTPFGPRAWSSDPHDEPSEARHTTMQPTPHEAHNAQPLVAHDDPSTRPSTATSISSHRDSDSAIPSSHVPHGVYPSVEGGRDDQSGLGPMGSTASSRTQARQPSDLQVVASVKYSGDVRMTLTAEILLDYPMPSFVGIPLKLAITGVTFDGVAIVASIKRKMHFCFLDPEDAAALVGEHLSGDQRPQKSGKDDPRSSLLGLLQEIHVESEIGRQDDGKQVLKNVGKVEKFVLEQVRKIFEEEFVFPSYWTFLV